MSSSPAADAVPPYKIGELIFVEQGQLLHEAKVLEMGDEQQRANGEDVLVHYPGWNSSWDVWAQLQHTRPITPASIAERARMKEELQASKRKTKKEAGGNGSAACVKHQPHVEAVFAARCIR